MGVITITISGSRPGGRRTRDKGQDLTALYLDLYERLQKALEEAASVTHDDYDPAEHPHAPAGQSNGGQFVSKGGGGGSPTGPKPTSVKAKLTKGALHELLSSGHAFTKKELLDIMGPDHKEVTVSTWLSKFKSQKHAGEYGALDIKKLPNGSYQVVMPNGQPAPPAPAGMPNLIEDLEKETKAKPTPTAPAPKASKIVVPPAPLSKGEADNKYAFHTEVMNEKLAEDSTGVSIGAVEKSVLAWKHAKLTAQAQWKTNTTGSLYEPKLEDKIYEADKLLAKDLFAAQGDSEQMKEALAKWKTNTQLEKQGKLGVKEPPKPSTQELSKAMGHWLDAVKDLPPPVPKPYEHLVPKGFKHIAPTDFTSGAGGFQSGILKLKSELIAKSKGSAESNKIMVEKDLANRLKGSKHYQAFRAAYEKLGNSQSLERRLVASWASSSGDHNSLSCALQQAAQDAFALPEKAVTKQQLGAITDYGESTLMKNAAGSLGVSIKTDEEVKGFRQALQEFTHAQYDHTQDFFKSLGQDHVFVARGMKMNPGASHMTDKPTNVKLQPASSFSADYATASMFAGSSGTVFLCKIPVSQVLGTYLTGFGCTSEHEVVVLGHDTIKSYPVKKKENMSLSAANESVKQRIADGPKKPSPMKNSL